MEKTAAVFWEKRHYSHLSELECHIKELKAVLAALPNWFIIDIGQGLEHLHFTPGEDFHTSYRIIEWVRNRYYSEPKNPHTALLELSDEDTEWGKWRNENLTGVFYHRIKFKSAPLAAMTAEMEKIISELTTLLNEWQAELAKEAKAKEERKALFAIEEEIEYIKPQGGEMGVDGFYEVVLRHVVSGTKLRMVQRNVFDFGTFAHPIDKTERAEWNEIETAAVKWMSEFGKFHGVRQ